MQGTYYFGTTVEILSVLHSSVRSTYTETDKAFKTTQTTVNIYHATPMILSGLLNAATALKDAATLASGVEPHMQR